MKERKRTVIEKMKKMTNLDRCSDGSFVRNVFNSIGTGYRICLSLDSCMLRLCFAVLHNSAYFQLKSELTFSQAFDCNMSPGHILKSMERLRSHCSPIKEK
jgi:hypothetical protein